MRLRPARFIQIATSVGEGCENLYALDTEGTVWFYDFTSTTWEELEDSDKE